MSANGMRTLRIVGSGQHYDTKILDAETGEDLGNLLCIKAIHYVVGDQETFPRPKVMIELGCPVILEINPPPPDVLWPKA